MSGGEISRKYRAGGAGGVHDDRGVELRGLVRRGGVRLALGHEALNVRHLFSRTRGGHAARRRARGECVSWRSGTMGGRAEVSGGRWARRISAYPRALMSGRISLALSIRSCFTRPIVTMWLRGYDIRQISRRFLSVFYVFSPLAWAVRRRGWRAGGGWVGGGCGWAGGCGWVGGAHWRWGQLGRIRSTVLSSLLSQTITPARVWLTPALGNVRCGDGERGDGGSERAAGGGGRRGACGERI